MRGAVSLAAALALAADRRRPFPERDLIIFLTFAVILATLVLQGLTLPALIRALGVRDDGEQEQHEELRPAWSRRRPRWRGSTSSRRRSGRATTPRAHAGALRLPQAPLDAQAGKIEDDGYEDRSLATSTMLREVIEAQRAELVRSAQRRPISNEVMRRIERELDLEDQRLEI